MLLKVKDFQAIKEATINVNGLTVLVGESSSGKSAFVRAIKGAFYNRFRVGQVRHGCDHSLIMAKYTKDGETLKVKRPQNGSPIYKLADTTYSKVGKSVPPEVEQFNNFGKLELLNDAYDLNFHSQFQKPLLLEFSQKKVMEILASSKALDDLNTVSKKLDDEKRDLKVQLSTLNTLLDENTTKLNEVRDKLNRCEPLISRLKSLEESFDNLSNNLDNLEILKDIIQEWTQLLQKRAWLEQLIKLLSSDLFERLENLQLFVNNSLKLQNLKVKQAGLISRIELLNKAQDKSSLLDKLQSFQDFNKHLSYLLKRKNELNDIVYNNICPICKNKIND